ncbi:MAG: glutamate--tRNA ligase [Ruminococcaceae bacterium]|nr:glutamate--tRNA ligase [Oscillospiraceae bacterium]
MDYSYLAQLLFPDVTTTPEELEERYPARDLPEGAKVTRFAPSPTGYVHFGGIYQAVVDKMLASQSGGVFTLRIEDTDGQREVEGAAEALIRTLEKYGITYDEGVILNEDGTLGERGAYGPYKQSQRGDIYAVYAKKLVAEGKAYPCFTTEEELEAIQQADKKAEIKNTDWHTAAAEKRAAMLAGRQFTMEEVEAHLKAGDPFVIRILSDGDPDKKVKFTDQVKGLLEVPENDEDFVLLKSDGIPTYHFAHAVDDHLMRTTHVIRGEDWLPSLPKHIQLFRYLGFRMPKYLHTAQILKMDENGGKKKISKRDMGAKMDDYAQLGYAEDVVWEYLLTLLNSNFEEWRMQNPDVPVRDYPFSIKKMSVSGCLFDFDKLNDVSKNVISRMTAEQVYDQVLTWAESFDPDFASKLSADPAYAKSILAIGRGGNKPRKDITVWSGVKDYMGFFYDEYFRIEDSYPDNFEKKDIITALEKFLESYDPADDSTVWFNKIKEIAPAIGFAPEMKLYKKDPDSYRGHVGDVSMFLRIAVTGKMNSPDMYSVMQILGSERVTARIRTMIASL